MTAANPHLRAILMAGVLAATAVALGMYTLQRQQVASNAAEPLPATTTVHLRTSPVATEPAATTPTATTPAKAPASHPAVAVAPKPEPVVDPYVKTALGLDLPKPVAAQFARNEVVVVTLYASTSAVDKDAMEDAKLGARNAAAGFAAVDVSKEGVSGRMARVFGVLSAPTSLVLTRPNMTQPFVTLPGYADSQTVQQAAANADPTPGVQHQTAWAKGADALCARATTQLEAIPEAKTKAQRADWNARVLQVGAAFAADLKQLTPQRGSEADVARFVSLQRQKTTLMVAGATATARNDLVRVATVSSRSEKVTSEAAALAIKLGAPNCA